MTLGVAGASDLRHRLVRSRQYTRISSSNINTGIDCELAALDACVWFSTFFSTVQPYLLAAYTGCASAPAAAELHRTIRHAHRSTLSRRHMSRA
eukprot:scaffold50393_cov33-Phaeocystis_antarctica.AAC.2